MCDISAYIKECLPKGRLFNPYLKECSIFEVYIKSNNNNNKSVISMYSFSNQTTNESDSFCGTL